MTTCGIVSFRLGMSDGVSVVATAWQEAFERLGWSTVTVAGEGTADRLLPGLAIDASAPPSNAELDAALADCDLVIVENLLSIPLNLPASRVLGEVLKSRPAILHHHDPPWQRERFSHITELPPDDPAWRHITINQRTQAEFEQRGLAATTVYNGFDTNPLPGRRDHTRSVLGIAADSLLVAHPVRAIERKNIPGAISLVEALDVRWQQGQAARACYWLPGLPEENYGSTLDGLLSAANCPIVRNQIEPEQLTISDLYAACDLVVFPSIWEGFGNPPIEAAIHQKPVVVGSYPVAQELRGMGFDWLDPADLQQIVDAVVNPSTATLKTNYDLAKGRFSLEAMTDQIGKVLEGMV